MLGRSAVVSDTGRRRRHNEDQYVCVPPLFAVADGMGGVSSLTRHCLQQQGYPDHNQANMNIDQEVMAAHSTVDPPPQ